MKNKYTGHLVDRDYGDIDRDLIGVSALKAQDIVKPDVNVAPAQGSPFLDRLKTAAGMLKDFNVIYRD